MKTTITSASVIGAIANAMYGRRRPNGVRVASRERAHDERQDDREDPLRREDDADEHGGAREALEDRRQIRGDGRDRPGEPERAEAEDPDEPRVLPQNRPAPTSASPTATAPWPGKSDIARV